MSKDGELRVTIRVEHRIGLDALTDLIAYFVYRCPSQHHWEIFERMPNRKIWSMVRDELHSYGYWWHETNGGDVGLEHYEAARPIAHRVWQSLGGVNP